MKDDELGIITTITAFKARCILCDPVVGWTAVAETFEGARAMLCEHVAGAHDAKCNSD